jgi:hypothetical protein
MLDIIICSRKTIRETMPCLLIIAYLYNYTSSVLGIASYKTKAKQAIEFIG